MALDMMHKLQRAEPLDPFQHFAGPFLKEVSGRMQWFVRAVKGDETLYGMPALDVLFEELDEKAKAKVGALTNEDVDHVRRFKHLLPESKRNRIKAIADDVASHHARLAAAPIHAKKKKKTMPTADASIGAAASASKDPTAGLASMFDD